MMFPPRQLKRIVIVCFIGLLATTDALGQMNRLPNRPPKSAPATSSTGDQKEPFDRLNTGSAISRSQAKHAERWQQNSPLKPASQTVAGSIDDRGSVPQTVVVLLIAISVLLIALSYCSLRLRGVQSQLSIEKSQGEKQRLIHDALEKRIQRLQRMESLGMLAGGIAHDFNNLLVGVIGNAELLKRWRVIENEEFVDQRAEQILLAAGKAADLSRQMLTYAGKQNTLRKRNNLNDITMEFSRVLQSGLNDIRQLRFELLDRPLYSLTDRTQIEQILLNLVSNAGRACGSKGPIIIRTGREKLTSSQIKADSHLYGTRNLGGDFVFVEVEDSGTGIAPEDLDHIFEPFFGKSDSGRGLGLSVVYGLVSAHEGLIRINSQLGIGTRIRVLLPESEPDAIQPADPIPATPIANSNPAIQNHGERPILVVDDDQTILDWIKLALEMEGFSTATTQSGKSIFDDFALDDSNDEPIRRSGLDQFSCMVLDVQMREMTGQEVLAELQRMNIRIPVILMSGFSQTQLSQFQKDPNVVHVLAKPFRIADLIDAVKTAVNAQVAV